MALRASGCSKKAKLGKGGDLRKPRGGGGGDFEGAESISDELGKESILPTFRLFGVRRLGGGHNSVHASVHTERLG